MKRVLVKLGGSLITDKTAPYTVRKDVLERLAAEIGRAWGSGDMRLVVGHGSGSYGHRTAAKYQTHLGFVRPDSPVGFARVQDDAARLNRIVVDALLHQGVAAVSISPSSAAVAQDGRLVEFFTRPLEAMLRACLLPVVYGDVGVDRTKGCCILSTEEILYHLACSLGARRVILVGKTDGVFTADPHSGPEARPIRRIHRESFERIRQHLAASDTVDVTGGMLQKVSQAVEASGRGIETQIIDGSRPGQLERALRGDRTSGTIILDPDDQPGASEG